MPPVPEIRLSALNDAPLNEKGRYVLYWMTASRRTRHNYGLQHAVWWCRRLGVPLMVLEALRCDYPYASDRLHAFILQGMAVTTRPLSRPSEVCATTPTWRRGKRPGQGPARRGGSSGPAWWSPMISPPFFCRACWPRPGPRRLSVRLEAGGLLRPAAALCAADRRAIATAQCLPPPAAAPVARCTWPSLPAPGPPGRAPARPRRAAWPAR